MNSLLSQNLYKKFMALDCEVQGHIHAGLRSAPMHNKRYVRWHSKKLNRLQNERDVARALWRDSIKDQPKPSRQQTTIENARGHEDLESTQAARRICHKNGWQW